LAAGYVRQDPLPMSQMYSLNVPVTGTRVQIQVQHRLSTLNVAKPMLALSLAGQTYMHTTTYGDEQCLINAVQCSSICPLHSTTLEDHLDGAIPPKPPFDAGPKWAKQD